MSYESLTWLVIIKDSVVELVSTRREFCERRPINSKHWLIYIVNLIAYPKSWGHCKNRIALHYKIKKVIHIYSPSIQTSSDLNSVGSNIWIWISLYLESWHSIKCNEGWKRRTWLQLRCVSERSTKWVRKYPCRITVYLYRICYQIILSRDYWWS